MAEAGWLQLRWRAEGAGRLVVPGFAGAWRVDGLWRSTCFELFAREPGQESYVEINLSPSENWAAYSFSGYRQGMREHSMEHTPVITPRRGGDVLILDGAVRMDALPDLPLVCALTAVLEEEGGVLSYWALVHPGERPDFHDPACFVATLGPAGGA